MQMFMVLVFLWTVITLIHSTTLRNIMTLDQYMTELTFPFKLIQKLSCYNTKLWMLNEVKVCIIMDPVLLWIPSPTLESCIP